MVSTSGICLFGIFSLNSLGRKSSSGVFFFSTFATSACLYSALAMSGCDSTHQIPGLVAFLSSFCRLSKLPPPFSSSVDRFEAALAAALAWNSACCSVDVISSASLLMSVTACDKE